MAERELTQAVWRKASRSSSNGGACVEAAPVWRKASRSSGNGGECVEAAPGGYAVAVRDSKDPDGPKLAVDPSAWVAFADAVKRGAYDDPRHAPAEEAAAT